MTAFDPSMNQPQSRVKMLSELESWAKYMPDWVWYTMSRLRPIIKRGGAMSPEDEEKLFKAWKTTNYHKSKGIVPVSEDKPFKPKVRKDFYV